MSAGIIFDSSVYILLGINLFSSIFIFPLHDCVLKIKKEVKSLSHQLKYSSVSKTLTIVKIIRWTLVKIRRFFAFSLLSKKRIYRVGLLLQQKNLKSDKSYKKITEYIIDFNVFLFIFLGLRILEQLLLKDHVNEQIKLKVMTANTAYGLYILYSVCIFIALIYQYIILYYGYTFSEIEEILKLRESYLDSKFFSRKISFQDLFKVKCLKISALCQIFITLIIFSMLQWG